MAIQTAANGWIATGPASWTSDCFWGVVTTPDVEADLESLLSPGQRHKRDTNNADDDEDA